MELDTQVQSAPAVLNTTLNTAASAEPDSRETATARDGVARDGAARDGATAAATHADARDGALATLAAASLALDQLITGAVNGSRRCRRTPPCAPYWTPPSSSMSFSFDHTSPWPSRCSRRRPRSHGPR